jgi:23S rRNA pseudouridine1911/1915/1917 synthase
MPLEPEPISEDLTPLAPDDLDAVETPLEIEEDGLEHRRIELRKVLPDRRLDKYLAGRLGKAMSRTSLQTYIREGSVTVNGRAVKPAYVLRAGDQIDLLLPPRRPQEIPAEPIPLDVVYEDDDMLAVNKQAGLIVHPARGNWTGTLVNALAYYFQKNWRDIRELPTSGEAFRPGIVHRLDRDTTGVILIAKTELALWRLGRQFELRKVHKTYTAIVHGRVGPDEDVIDVPIGKHPKIREKYAVDRRTGEPYPVTTKQAVTRYKVIERIGPVGDGRACFSLVELYPKTGRTHQLRVHMSYIGHPIVGDRMYGGGPLYRHQLVGAAAAPAGALPAGALQCPRSAAAPAADPSSPPTDALITRQALHAHTIRFSHPRTGKELELSAPWPADFTNTWKELQTLAHTV